METLINKISLTTSMLTQKVQDEIITALSDLGTGASIIEIEKKVKCERHTLSKYLSIMQNIGIVQHRNIGKAKVWSINNAPIQTVFNSLSDQNSYVEKVLSDIIENMPNGLIIIDKDYNIIFMNELMRKKYGKSSPSFSHLRVYDSVFGHENPLQMRKLRNVAEGITNSCEFEQNDKFGNILNVKVSKMMNTDKTFSLLLMVEDISEKRKIQDEIVSQKNLLEAERLALNKSAILAETDLHGKIIYANDMFCKISGYSRDELIGNTHRLINSNYHPKSFFSNMWKTISGGNIWTGLIKNKAKNGKFYWVNSAIAPVLGKDGKPVKFIAIRFDITKYLTKYGGKEK